jgi:hypothetical protein
MTVHAILIQKQVSAQTNPALNRSVISGCDIDNGNVFTLSHQNGGTGLTEVWDVIQPTTGSIGGLWMAAAPEVVTTISGANKFRGIDVDPRNFYTAASTVFDAYKPMPGDIITLTADALDSGTSQQYAVAAIGTFKLAWAADPSTNKTFSMHYLGTDPIAVGSGSAIGTSHVAAFKFEVLNNNNTAAGE